MPILHPNVWPTGKHAIIWGKTNSIGNGVRSVRPFVVFELICIVAYRSMGDCGPVVVGTVPWFVPSPVSANERTLVSCYVYNKHLHLAVDALSLLEFAIPPYRNVLPRERLLLVA